jgi:hypothetical protein
MPRSPPKLTAREWHTATSGTIGKAIRFRAVRRDLVNPHEVTDRRSAAAVVRPPISGGFLLCGATKTVI